MIKLQVFVRLSQKFMNIQDLITQYMYIHYTGHYIYATE